MSTTRFKILAMLKKSACCKGRVCSPAPKPRECSIEPSWNKGAYTLHRFRALLKNGTHCALIREGRLRSSVFTGLTAMQAMPSLYEAPGGIHFERRRKKNNANVISQRHPHKLL